MFSMDEGGRASLMDATSKTGGSAVCPNHTTRPNNRLLIKSLSVCSISAGISRVCAPEFYCRIRIITSNDITRNGADPMGRCEPHSSGDKGCHKSRGREQEGH